MVIMDRELVSIVTPMYKGAAFVAETIESVLKQSYRNWEMIIVDDCSPDGGAGVKVVSNLLRVDKTRVPLEQGISPSNGRRESISHFSTRTISGIRIFYASSLFLWLRNRPYWYFLLIGELTN